MAAKKVSEWLGDGKDAIELLATTRSLRESVTELTTMMDSLKTEIIKTNARIDTVEEKSKSAAKDIVNDKLLNFSEKVFGSVAKVDLRLAQIEKTFELSASKDSTAKISKSKN